MEKSININSSESEIIVVAIRSLQKQVLDEQTLALNSIADADERIERVKELQKLSNRAQQFMDKLADEFLGK